MKWSKLISLLLVIVCVLGLNRCRTPSLTFRGEVIAIEDNGGNPLFLIRTDRDREYCILTDNTTLLHSWLEGTDAEALTGGELEQPVVQVYITTRPRSMRVDGTRYKAYLADQIILLSVVEPDGYSLPGGTKLDIRRYDDRITYQAKDGTAILSEELPLGPDRVHVGGQVSLEALEPAAQQRILDWYERQGLLYDLDEILQAAYDAYTTCENKAEFQERLVRQEVYPSGNNETLVWFNTTITTPMNGQNVTEQRSSAAFRRDTGEYVPLEDLFSCPAEEIAGKVLDAAGTAANYLEDEKKAFRPAYVVFDSGALEVWFPAGSLPDTEYTSIVAVDYDRLTGILHPWAIPVSCEQ